MLIYFNTEGINLYFLCPFISFFCLVGASFVGGQSKFGKYAYTQNIVVSFGEMLAIIPYLISLKIEEDTYKESPKKRSMTKKENQLKSEKYQLEYNDVEEELSQINICHVILLGFVDFLQSFSIFYGNELYYNNYQIYFWSSYILFLCFFKKIILNNRVYRHQIVSFIIFFIFDLIYTILILTDKQIKYNRMQLIFLIISNCCFSFETVFEKNLLDKTFISIYKLCFLLGLFTFIYNLILSIITSVVAIKLQKKNKYLFKFSDYFGSVEDVPTEIFLIFIFVLLNGFYNILQFVIIKYLSPNHTLITQLVLAIYMTIITKFMKGKISNITFIFAIVFHVICFITLLIFLEIIQLNFCGINRDTKLHIGLRSDVDRYFDTFSAGTFNENPNNERSMSDTSFNKTTMNKTGERTDSVSESSEAENSFD